ncbi:hypothetical protein PR202_gb15302 [Eleusine coracana subsp. coracana]|uniref:Carrier domain-containing protein n=1 Tax=Eleusine coracana subsp. coracana TaxID=191504 RepID=A0AAV5EX97_ELECO|nr:hypothetical protein PR202_gb15302 [Eleusine coracana subsp. coracana]
METRRIVDPAVRPQLRSKVKNSTEIIEFLTQLVSDQSGVPKDKVSPTDSLPSYGFDSIAVVRAAQKLSDFLGTPVGAIDIFTANCISELADFLVNLVHNSRPQAAPQPRSKLKNSKEIVDFLIQIVSDQTGIPKDKISPTDSLPSYGFDSITVVRAAQKLSDFLCIPVGAIDIFTASCIAELASLLENLVLKSQPQLEPDESCFTKHESPMISMDDISSDLSVFATGTLQLLGLTYVCFILLLPAYIAIDFVKWWALNKAQALAAKILAVHLKGTIFLNYWLKMQGARIGSCVIIDTVDITDPSLLTVADGALIAEGVLIQGHEVHGENEVVELNDLERELFSKVQTIDYYTTVLKIEGFEHMPKGFYYFGEHMDDPATIGHPVAMQRFFADTNIFLFWSYGNSADIKGPYVSKCVTDAVTCMGGSVPESAFAAAIQVFPSYMKHGFYERVESQLQGFQNTYYVGVTPYVKRLFSLSRSNPLPPKDIGELEGVEFPDLLSLDGYLQYWGTHKVTEKKFIYTWINEEGKTMNLRTYHELHYNASYIAYKLLTSVKPVIKPGDRVLLIHLPGLEFVDAFFGCIRAGVIPVPVLPPDPMQWGGQALLKVENVSKVCNAVAILSTSSYHAAFTSGSTGDAKGVMITHGGLIHNVKMMKKRYRSTSKTVLISWLPQYHDMGLIGGLFTALVSGGTSILFSPMTFIRNPLLWLQTINDYHGTHSAGPNFAFELVIRRLEAEKNKIYDLSSMVFLMIAAEPVRHKTVKRFIELTRPLGLSEDWQGRVCCGYVGPNDTDVVIKIVDADSLTENQEDGSEGEIWISSPSSGVGYWSNKEISQKTFFNKLKNYPDKMFTRTDVEKTVEGSSEVLRPGCCAVVGVPEEVLTQKGISIPDSSDQVGLVVIAEQAVLLNLASLLENLVLKSQPQLEPDESCFTKHESPMISMDDISSDLIDFVKWWALNKAQALAAKILAVHLKGTIFLNYWLKMQGARIGSCVIIDTVDITDPSLLTVADGALIAEGVLIQGHEVRNEVLSFRHVKIGQNASVGPYAVLQKGTSVQNSVFVQPLHKTEQGKSLYQTNTTSAHMKEEARTTNMAFRHFVSIYAVGFMGALSSAIVFMLYTHFTGTRASLQLFSFACVAGAFHWLPAVITTYAVIVQETPTSPVAFALFIALAYLSYGIILSLLTSIANKALATRTGTQQMDLMTGSIQRRITISAHLRFAKMLSGTEAFCIYLRLLGAKIGKHCSIRAINPVANPELISIGDGVHLGDFCNIVPEIFSKGFTGAEIKVQDNTVVGSGSLLLPGSVLQENVILGALSVAPQGSLLQRGGVYVGAQSLTLVKNTLLAEDERIEEMDPMYKKIVGNLAANLAITTMNVKSRYFHRIGVSGRGLLKMYQDIPSVPKHKIFGAGKSFPVIVRHSNSLSADDDARLDARGAALRILSDDGEVPLLDLTLKSGNAFYARTIADFATWLVCGLQAREEHVKHAPHIRDAVWGSLRNTNSYTELHYYSNICRLLRFEDGREMYAKFKLRPVDQDISEDSGQVVPQGILPPETGAIPRDEDDTRPLLFLADDFRRRVESPEGVRYVLQLQLRDVPTDSATRDIALDCTRPWDEAEFPYIEVGEISINHNLPTAETEKLEFNPFLRCQEVDVISATSCKQSASIDHGRSLVYEICQRLRNGEPLPASWRAFLEQSDTKIDLSGCPVIAATRSTSNLFDAAKVTLARAWYQAFWATLCQPLLQTFVPYFVVGLVIFLPLRGLLAVSAGTDKPLYWLLPFFWVTSGVTAMATCAAAKWALVGRRADGDMVHIWAPAVFLDTVWQAIRTVTAEYFAELTPGSVLFAAWMQLMGSSVAVADGVYVDSMGALLNPEMVHLERGASVGRDALLFGHVYEGEAGKVKFGEVHVGEDGFVGSRAVVMPGVRVEDGGCLGALGLAMKEEIIKNKT